MRCLVGLFLAGCAAGAPLPPEAAALNQAGIEALERGDLETADARFSVALEHSPRFVDALVNLGLVELERGNFGRARILVERARRLNPDVAQPHHALGVLEERTGRPDRASRSYYAALAVDPSFAPPRSNLARLLFASGQLEEALVQYQRLQAVASDDPGALSGLIETLLRLGRTGEADALLASGLERFSDREELAVLAARADLRSGRIDQALVRLTPLARRRDETGASALGWLGAASLAACRPREAMSHAARALRLDPDHEVATVVLALSLAELDAPEAPVWIARARRISPSDPLLARLPR
jgi:tetratricopeptide (TPR) repeat protein